MRRQMELLSEDWFGFLLDGDDFSDSVPTSDVVALLWVPPDPTSPECELAALVDGFRSAALSGRSLLLLPPLTPASFPASFRRSAACWFMLSSLVEVLSLCSIICDLSRSRSCLSSSTRLVEDESFEMCPLIGGREPFLWRWFDLLSPSWLRAIVSWLSSCFILLSWARRWAWLDSFYRK